MKILFILQVIIFASSNCYAEQRSPVDTLNDYIAGEDVAWIGKIKTIIGCNGHIETSKERIRIYQYVKQPISEVFEHLSEAELIASLGDSTNLYAMGKSASCASRPVSKKDPIPICYQLVNGKISGKFIFNGREIPLIESSSLSYRKERCFYHYEKQI